MADTVWFVLTLLVEFLAIFLVVTFLVHLLVQSVPTARLRQAMTGRPLSGMALALVFGALTPFCSCSTVPLVAGMAAAGVPVAALTAFLVLSPLVNPATVALLATLVSPLYAAGFVLVSMLLALIVAGVVTTLGVRPTLTAVLRPSAPPGPPPAIGERVRLAARRSVRDLRALAPLLGGVALVGALLYGRVDAGLIGRAIEAAGPWAVPVAVLAGVPVYASTAVLLPLGTALLATGANLGVVTAFLIGATGLSLPEGVMLQRLLGTRYLTVLVAAFVVTAIILGYLLQGLVPSIGTMGPTLLR
jgi:uncharacterized protein